MSYPRTVTTKSLYVAALFARLRPWEANLEHLHQQPPSWIGCFEGDRVCVYTLHTSKKWRSFHTFPAGFVTPCTSGQTFLVQTQQIPRKNDHSALLNHGTSDNVLCTQLESMQQIQLIQFLLWLPAQVRNPYDAPVFWYLSLPIGVEASRRVASKATTLNFLYSSQSCPTFAGTTEFPGNSRWRTGLRCVNCSMFVGRVWAAKVRPF